MASENKQPCVKKIQTWCSGCFLLMYLSLLILRAPSYAAEPAAFTLTAANISEMAISYATENFSGVGTIELENRKGVTGLSVSGSVFLNAEDSFVRLILVDEYGNEFLILESTPLLNAENLIIFSDYCEETLMLDAIDIDFISVESNNADIRITDVSLAFDIKQQTEALKTSGLIDEQQNIKINQINKNLQARNMKWVAGETPLSGMSYAEKKQMMGGRLPNLYGFDYYIGGIFEIPASETKESATSQKSSQYVSEFNWRERHGTDWMTPVKNQGGCGSCWAFAGTGTVEHYVNVYFNRAIDVDLSEQEIVSCNTNNYSCKGGNTFSVYRYSMATGISDETCFSYTASDPECTDKCANPSESIKIGGYTKVDSTTDDFVKHAIINNGPLSTGISTWAHAVGLVGYKTMKAGDRIFIKAENVAEWYTIPDDDPLVGQTVWLIKNSWGSGWGESGYAYIVADLNNVEHLDGPVTSLQYSDSDIRCTDADNDGYYYWGSGEKPAHCPASPPEPDGDDSNPDLGPMDSFGNLMDISEYIAIASPLNLAVIDAGSNISFEAVEKTISSIITKVEFFQNNIKIGEDTTSPYAVQWQTVPVGCYTITAVAATSTGEQLTATPIKIMVKGASGSGTISRSVWTEIAGTSVSSLLTHPYFVRAADFADELTSFEAPENWGDSYGTIVAGYVHPPASGDYVFFIAGDDNCELLIGTDFTKESASLIASVPGWTDSRQWDKFTEQQSAIVPLEADKLYYIEARHKESGGGDNLAVAWQIPGFTMGVIDGAYLSPYDEKYDLNYTVSFEAGMNGSLNGVLEQDVNYGENSTVVMALAQPGYHFTQWTGDYTGTDNPLRLDNITGDMSVIAEFERDITLWTVKFIVDGNGTIEGNMEQQIEDGQDASPVKALPDSQYRFTGWTGDYKGAGETLSISGVSGNMEIRAGFSPVNNADSIIPDESAGGCFIQMFE